MSINAMLHYRAANEADIDKLIPLGVLAYGQYRSFMSEEEWQTMLHSLQSRDMYRSLLDTGKGFVCLGKDGIIGMAFLIYHGNPWTFYPAEWSYVRMVGADPAYKGAGIGRQLMQLCIDEAIKSGEQVIALHTSEQMHAARHIYESLGFKVEQELPVRYGMKYWLYKMPLQ
ncbi:MAG: GNAT family N-acetyltransferase [Bacteroidetes bacterium]|nr:GNAT family N-acetyltransferase [Bacteroidota bacterium]